MPLIMGIDLGTSSVKIIIMDEDGKVLASDSAGYPLQTPAPGWVEQQPQDWWKAVCNSIQSTLQILEENPEHYNRQDLVGVSISGQMNGAVFLDEANNLLGPAILWLDGRSQAACDEANDRAGDLLAKHALTVLNPINTLAKILWCKTHNKEVYRRTNTVLVPKDWVRYKLTGSLDAEVSDASVTGALDLFTRTWSDEIIDALEIRKNLFPDLHESIDTVGKITEPAAEATGLPLGLPVSAGGGDMACMAVGSGAIKPGVVGIGIGTAGHAITFADTVSDAAFNKLWPMCHGVPGAYFWLGCSYTGGGSMTWYQEQFEEDFEMLNTRASQAPPGCDDLFFLPWLAGSATPHPDARARACWIGLTLHHTRGHMIRALMEGVAYDLRQSLACFRALQLPIDEIRLGEGGVKSILWRQILVDAFGQNGKLMELRDASAVGAAIIAGVGVGLFDSFETGCDRCIGIGDTVHFEDSNARIYDRQFEKYDRLYPALKPWFAQNF